MDYYGAELYEEDLQEIEIDALLDQLAEGLALPVNPAPLLPAAADHLPAVGKTFADWVTTRQAQIAPASYDDSYAGRCACGCAGFPSAANREVAGDGEPPLGEIPWTDPGTAPGKPRELPAQPRLVDPATEARRSIRFNLQHFKAKLVNQIDIMLQMYPPKFDGVNVPEGYELTPEERAEVANRVADILIHAVDEFLRTHPGARPHRGHRNYLLDKYKLQDEFNAPWCDDWCNWMLDFIQNRLLKEKVSINGKEVSLSTVIWVSRMQANRVGWHGAGQHNFVILYPYGHFNEIGAAPAQSRAYLMFDPWIDCLPHAYRPGVDDHVLPTHPGVSGDYKGFYWELFRNIMQALGGDTCGTSLR